MITIVEIETAKVCKDVAAVCWMEDHPGLAAWAQMVSIVLTLIAGYIFARMPIEHQRRERRRAELRILSKVAAEIGEIKHALRVAAECVEAKHFSQDAFSAQAARITAAADILSSLDQAVPGASDATMVRIAVDVARSGAAAMRQLVVHPIYQGGVYRFDPQSSEAINTALEVATFTHVSFLKQLPQWRPGFRNSVRSWLKRPFKYSDGHFQAAAPED